jgi:group I intron endonuclease
MAIVYRITNKTNGKSYIGQSVRTVDQRWKAHLSSVRQGSKFRFHSAIRKYGVDDWKLEILFEHDDIDLCKKKEEELIKQFDLTNNKNGYNAKPGGCGGWIVPDEKYENWRQKQPTNNIGLNNSNSVGYTNEQLIEIGIMICSKIGRIIGHSTMIKECAEIGIRFPKSFRPMRFDGSYKNYAKILEKELDMKFDPYFRTDEHRQKLREVNLGKVGYNRNTTVIIIEGKRKHVKN